MAPPVGSAQILHVFCCFQQFAAIMLPAASAPFGIPETSFWMYVCASLLTSIGLIKIFRELPPQHGSAKVMPFGRLFFAIPIAVFGTEHFTLTATIAAMVPRWIPAHTFWVYVIGAGFLCAGLSITVCVQAWLAAALVAMTFLIFVCTMDLPGALAHPHNRFFWALALRELAFGSGAFALAITLWSPRPAEAKPAKPAWAALPRVFVGVASLFYGVEELLHPAHVPGIPLEKLTPAWIPGNLFLSYLLGVSLIVGGVCLLANKMARLAATILGLAILLAVLWVYLPILLAAPKDVEALNYFFDTLLFCGTLLLLANSLENEPAVARTYAEQTAG
jgi:uncharacterized membrane protein